VAACAAAIFIAANQATRLDAQGVAGAIVGHVRLTGPAPPNTIIRMGGDPRCSRAAAGKRLTQDAVLRSADGGLANTFVNLQGSFPASAPPAQPVTIDQQGCLFVPRMIGARVGQVLQVTNSDPTGHNVHSLSTHGNEFNVSQPKQGMANKFPLKAEDVVMRIKCDIHSWMISYVGVVPHPYFAVSGMDGAFTIKGVPAGRHTIQTWHEQYGRLTRTVDVKAGQTATVDFAYTGKEKPSTAGIIELVVPPSGQAVTLTAAR
jgi:plastocyanin